jgi:hypothetical protein
VIQSPHLNACPQYSIVLFEHPPIDYPAVGKASGFV